MNKSYRQELLKQQRFFGFDYIHYRRSFMLCIFSFYFLMRIHENKIGFVFIRFLFLDALPPVRSRSIV